MKVSLQTVGTRSSRMEGACQRRARWNSAGQSQIANTGSIAAVVYMCCRPDSDVEANQGLRYQPGDDRSRSGALIVVAAGHQFTSLE